MENKHLNDKNQWTRILYMILFGIILCLSMYVVTLLAVVQAIFALFTGNANEDIQDFSKDLVRYVKQLVSFLLYLDNRRPFPFNDLESKGDEQTPPPKSVDDDKTNVDDDMHSSR